MKQKICFITTIPGTLKSFVIPTAKMLHERLGVEITFICDKDDAFAKILPEYIQYIPISMKRGVDIKGVKSLLSLYKIFKENQFDIVQYSTPNAALYASIAARMISAPIRLYGQWGLRYVGFSGFRRKIFKFIEKTICLNSTHIRSVSKLNRLFGISEGLYPKTKVKVIGNGGTIGVDLDNYDIRNKELWRNEIRSLYNIPTNDFVFCFCGRISSDKGASELLEAFRQVTRKHPQTHLMLLGGKEKNHGISSELLEWAQNSPYIHLCGRVDGQEISHYYSAADVLVHPSYREGFGMVIQEAGALGIPVITTRIPGAGEVMEDGISCLLVKPKNTKQLENAMLRLIENPALLSSLSNEAYARTVQLYDRKVMLANQLADYETLFQKEEDVKHIILTETDLWSIDLPKSVELIKISGKTIAEYNHNEKVIAIVGSRALTQQVIKLDFPSLRLFQLTSAGFDNVPCAEFAAKGISVANAGTTYSIPIAETVVFGILHFAKRLRINPNDRSSKILRHYNKITELAGKKAIVLGAGNIGTAISHRLIAFDVKVDGYDPYCPVKPEYGRIIRTKEELSDELYNYDYVISTLPDTSSTKGFIDKHLLKEFKSDAVFVNVGRQATYNEDDLYATLKRKEIKGAILDIFQKLPNPITNKFRRLKNVIVWPGLSAISQEVRERLNSYICENLLRLLEGQDVMNIINKRQC